MSRAILFFFLTLLLWVFLLVASVHLISTIFEVELSRLEIDVVEKFSGILAVITAAIVFSMRSGTSIKFILGFRRIKLFKLLMYSLPAVLYVFLIAKFGRFSNALIENSSFWTMPELVTIIFLAPVMEELLYRGGMFSDSSKSKIQTCCVWVFTSISFFLIHAHFTFNAILGMSVVSFYLGYVRVKTNTVIAPIFIHAAINTSIVFYVIYLM